MTGEIESARVSWRRAIDDAKFWRRRAHTSGWSRAGAYAWDRHDHACKDAARHFRRYHEEKEAQS